MGEDQAVYVLEGLVSFYANGEWLHCPQGTCVHLPSGSEQTYSAECEQARLLVVLVPAGLEANYREFRDGDGASLAGTPNFERLVTVAARYGVEIAVPEAGTGAGERRERMEQG